MATTSQTTQLNILNVAQDLFCKKGYHNTSIANIASGCQLSKASLYHHITSKESLLCDVVKRAHQQLRDDIFTPILTGPTQIADSLQHLFTLLNKPQNKNNVFLLMRIRIDLYEKNNSATHALDNYFTDWENTLHQIFTQHRDVDNIMSIMHGAVTFSKLHNNENKLNHAEWIAKNITAA